MHAVVDYKKTILVHYEGNVRNFIVEDISTGAQVEMHHSQFEGDGFKYPCDFRAKFLTAFPGKTDCMFTEEGENAYITLMNANRDGIFTPYVVPIID